MYCIPIFFIYCGLFRLYSISLPYNVKLPILSSRHKCSIRWRSLILFSLRQDPDLGSGAAGRSLPASLQRFFPGGLCHRRESAVPVLSWLLPTAGLLPGTLQLLLAKMQGRETSSLKAVADLRADVIPLFSKEIEMRPPPAAEGLLS